MAFQLLKELVWRRWSAVSLPIWGRNPAILQKALIGPQFWRLIDTLFDVFFSDTPQNANLRADFVKNHIGRNHLIGVLQDIAHSLSPLLDTLLLDIFTSRGVLPICGNESTDGFQKLIFLPHSSRQSLALPFRNREGYIF